MKVNVNNGDLNKAIRTMIRARSALNLTVQNIRQKEVFVSKSEINRKIRENKKRKAKIEQLKMHGVNKNNRRFKSSTLNIKLDTNNTNKLDITDNRSSDNNIDTNNLTC